MKTASVVSYIAFLLLFGVLVPWFKGLSFLDPLIVVPYACLSLLFAAPAAADGVMALRAGRSGSVTRVVVQAVAIGWLSGVLVLGVGLTAVNWFHGYGRTVLPPVKTLGSALALSLAGSILVAGLAALLALRAATRESVRHMLRFGFLGLLVVFVFVPPALPRAWQNRLALIFTSDGIAGLTLWLAPLAAVAGAALARVASKRWKASVEETPSEHLL
jgi:hypothetical protein